MCVVFVVLSSLFICFVCLVGFFVLMFGFVSMCLVCCMFVVSLVLVVVVASLTCVFSGVGIDFCYILLVNPQRRHFVA